MIPDRITVWHDIVYSSGEYRTAGARIWTGTLLNPAGYEDYAGKDDWAYSTDWSGDAV
jgi:hypothetical protein